jgi:hypothetical protein
MRTILTNLPIVVGIALIAIGFGGRAPLITGVVLVVLGALLLV